MSTYTGTCLTTRAIAATKLGCAIREVVVLSVAGNVWTFGVSR